MKKLFTTEYGSRLYGTNTPESDVDLKHIVLPNLNDILIGKRINNVVKKTNKKEFTKNSAEDIDEEFIPIQIFAQDFLNGQTYALELAYAIESNHAGQIIHDHAIHPFIKELRRQFLTSDIKAMVGYSVNQASLYSLKGERLNAIKNAYNLFEEIVNQVGEDATINDHKDLFEKKASVIANSYPKYFQLTEYEIDRQGTMRPCLKLLEKTLPYTGSFEYNFQVIKAQLAKYGNRAEAASIDNVDWKATMHAVRIVDEGISLLSGKGLVYPYESWYIKHLLKIKYGELDYIHVIDTLNSKLETLKNLEMSSALPRKTNDLKNNLNSWLADQLHYFYKI